MSAESFDTPTLALVDEPGKLGTVVIIHGWCSTHATMAPLARLFPHHRRLRPDLLGHGSSPLASDYSIEAQARAVVSALTAATCAPRPILIGHSMGAQIAIELATSGNVDPSALILLDPAQIFPVQKVLDFRETFTRALGGQNPGKLVAELIRASFTAVEDEAEVAAQIAAALATPAEVVRAAWEAIGNWDGPSAVAKIKCPTLLISPSKPINRPDAFPKMNGCIMTAQVAGAGHNMQFEVMDQIGPMIRRFLSLNGLETML
ncbi:MAG: alpha/beta hydrolase [Pseudomonadota bacterium]